MLRIVTNITLRLRPALLLFSAESLCWRTNVETRTKETTVSKQGKFGRRLFFVTGLLLINVVVVLAQGGDAERRFWPPDFRPPTGKKSPVRKQTAQPRYRPASPALPQNANFAKDSVLGVTVWLLTDSPDDKDGARILRPKTGRPTNYTAKRVETTTKFTVGQKLRLSIEIPRNGYLYVIDQEKYEDDGSLSEPYLIFPVIPGENNFARKGRVFEVPSAGDDSSLTVKLLDESGKRTVVAEVLTFLVTTKKLLNVPNPILTSNGEYDIIKLDEKTLAEWEKDCDTNFEAAELEGGAGQLYTTREQLAGRRKKTLTQADPLPQTVFRIAAKPGKSLLVKIPLQIAGK